MKTLEERFWDKTDRRGPTDCWPWKARRLPGGYGVFYVAGKLCGAHRVAYELLVGPIPEGKQIDHQCHNDDPSCHGGKTCPHRGCVNPAHLAPATQKENMRRGRNHLALKTHCPYGHPYSGDNLYIPPSGIGRQCRICIKTGHHRRYVERARAAGVQPKPASCPKCSGPYETRQSGKLKGRRFCRPCTNASRRAWKAARAARASQPMR